MTKIKQDLFIFYFFNTPLTLKILLIKKPSNMSNKIFAKRNKTELTFNLDLSQDDHSFNDEGLNEFTLSKNNDSVTISDENGKELVTIKSSSDNNTRTICLVLPKSDTTNTDPLQKEKATISLILV